MLQWPHIMKNGSVSSPFTHSLTHLLDEDVLNGLELVRLAHGVGAADPQATAGAVPRRVDLAREQVLK